jgi:hypothetical protein
MRERCAEFLIDLEIYQFKATIWIRQAASGLPAGFAGGGAPFPWELRPKIGDSYIKGVDSCIAGSYI